MRLRLRRRQVQAMTADEHRGVWAFWATAWLGMLALAFANGTARALGYQPLVGELAARQIATQILLGLLAAYVWVLHRRRPLPTTRTALAVGSLWTALTLAFEFGFGHYVAKTPWELLLAEYDLFQGRIWVLVPIATTVTPAIVHAVQARQRR